MENEGKNDFNARKKEREGKEEVVKWEREGKEVVREGE